MFYCSLVSCLVSAYSRFCFYYVIICSSPIYLYTQRTPTPTILYRYSIFMAAIHFSDFPKNNQAAPSTAHPLTPKLMQFIGIRMQRVHHWHALVSIVHQQNKLILWWYRYMRSILFIKFDRNSGGFYTFFFPGRSHFVHHIFSTCVLIYLKRFCAAFRIDILLFHRPNTVLFALLINSILGYFFSDAFFASLDDFFLPDEDEINQFKCEYIRFLEVCENVFRALFFRNRISICN